VVSVTGGDDQIPEFSKPSFLSSISEGRLSLHLTPREDQSGRISASELRSLFQKLGEDRNRLTTELGGMGRLWWWRNPRCEVVGREVFEQLGREDGEASRLCQMIRIIYFNLFHGVDLWNRFLGHLATGTDPNR